MSRAILAASLAALMVAGVLYAIRGGPPDSATPSAGQSGDQSAPFVPASSQDESFQPADSLAPEDTALSGPDRVSLTEQKTPRLQPARHLFESIDETMLDRSILEQYRNNELIKRYRVVTIDADYLRDLIRDLADQPLVIELFPDVMVTAIPTDRQEWYDGERTGFASWVGALPDQPLSNIYFIVQPSGQVSGSASIESGRYRLEHTDQPPFHIVTEEIEMRID